MGQSCSKCKQLFHHEEQQVVLPPSNILLSTVLDPNSNPPVKKGIDVRSQKKRLDEKITKHTKKLQQLREDYGRFKNEMAQTQTKIEYSQKKLKELTAKRTELQKNICVSSISSDPISNIQP